VSGNRWQVMPPATRLGMSLNPKSCVATSSRKVNRSGAAGPSQLSRPPAAWVASQVRAPSPSPNSSRAAFRQANRGLVGSADHASLSTRARGRQKAGSRIASLYLPDDKREHSPLCALAEAEVTQEDEAIAGLGCASANYVEQRAGRIAPPHRFGWGKLCCGRVPRPRSGRFIRGGLRQDAGRRPRRSDGCRIGTRSRVALWQAKTPIALLAASPQFHGVEWSKLRLGFGHLSRCR
jgi:hypothetical protein